MEDYYRLSSQVVPDHYDLYLEPDLENCVFQGRVEIDLDIKEEITELVVNAHAFTDLSVLHLIKLGNIQNTTTEVNSSILQHEGLKPVAKSNVQVEQVTDSNKRRRSEEQEEFAQVVAKKSRPAGPGRFRKQRNSESEKSAGSDSDTSTKPPSPPPPQQQPPKDNTADKAAVVVEKKKEPEVPNDNVKAGTSGGLLLLRSEWTGPSDESSDEEDYARQRFIEEDEERQSEENENEEDDNYNEEDDNDRRSWSRSRSRSRSRTYSEVSDRPDDEGGYVLSSDESETNVDKVVDDVCYVGDEDDSDDVMQVDGAFDTEGTEESEGDGNSSSSSSDENSDKVDKDKDTDAEKQEPEEIDNKSSNENPAENIEEDKALNLQLDEDNMENKKQMDESSNHSQQSAPVSETLEDKEETVTTVASILEEEEGDENIVDDEKCNEDIEEEKDTVDDEGDGVNNDRECSDEDMQRDILEEVDNPEKEENIDENDHEVDNPEKDNIDENDPDIDNPESPERDMKTPEIPDQELEIASIKFLRDKQVVVIKTTENIPAGKYKLAFQFSGDLDDSLRGFYRTKHVVNGETKWGAACHFEATGARKCFPCMDQPEFRSTFDISVKRPNQHVEVLSNMPCQEESEEIIKFKRTPNMPTYLICLVIGYYDSISRKTESGVRISAYTQVGQIIQAEYALDIATKALQFYQDFFNINYTLPKMDLVAVPDFYIGAMENWGLLTFRETALLFHPLQSTLSRRQYVAILVCHEIAHQWFGNLVSVAWWDQTWLKEGFATWISFLAVDYLFPEFDIWSDFLTTEMTTALRLDTLDSSHPIQVEVHDPGQIDEIFDTISYNKGASIIHMLFHWIGESAFQSGMHKYLSTHSGSSARTSDLWRALDTGSSPSVADVMDQWTTLQGYPTLNVRMEDGSLIINQTSRLSQSWKIPLKLPGDQMAVIGSEEFTVNLDPGVSGFPLVNVGQTSFCRVSYDWDSILKHYLVDIKTLAARDKAGIISNLALDFMRSGVDTKLHLLELVGHYSGETEWVVVDALLSVLDDIESLVQDTKAWAGYLQLAYSILLPILDKVGWDEEKLSGNITFTQGAVIQRLGKLGHSDTCGEATLLWQREERGGQPLGKSIRPAVYRTVAAKGGQREMNYFLNLYRNVQRNEEKRMLLTVLGSFTNINIMQQMLEWSMSDEVKQQDRVFLISCIAETGLEGRCAAFKFFQDNFAELNKQYTSGSLLKRLIMGVIKHFNTPQDLDNIIQFFQNNHVAGAQRTIEQCTEDIRNLIQARESSQDEILRYLTEKFPAEDSDKTASFLTRAERRSLNTSFDKAVQRV